jgi:hypothetical protein
VTSCRKLARAPKQDAAAVRCLVVAAQSRPEDPRPYQQGTLPLGGQKEGACLTRHGSGSYVTRGSICPSNWEYLCGDTLVSCAARVHSFAGGWVPGRSYRCKPAQAGFYRGLEVSSRKYKGPDRTFCHCTDRCRPSVADPETHLQLHARVRSPHQPFPLFGAGCFVGWYFIYASYPLLI